MSTAASPARAPAGVMLLALTATFAMSQAFRTVAAILAAPLQAEFGLSPQQLGSFAGAFHFAFGAMQLFMGIGIDLSVHGMKGSTVLDIGSGWCVPKAALLAAACRAAGIPARVGYADVRNHLSTERLRQNMGSDLFVWHGYTDIWLAGQWLKATPAFNIELCDRFGLLPLEFDGRADSIYHPFDKAGNRHMEYVAMHGAFDDVPLQRILDAFAEHYPNMPLENPATQGDFAADAAAERAAQRRQD